MPFLREIHATRTAFLLTFPFLLYLVLPSTIVLPTLKALKYFAAFTIIQIWLVKAFHPPSWLYRTSEFEFQLPPAPYEPFPVAPR